MSLIINNGLWMPSAANPANYISGSAEYQGVPGHPYTSASITFPAQRIVIAYFLVGNAATTTLSGVTIDGVTATVRISHSTTEFICGIADAVVTGGAGTVVFTASDTTAWKRATVAAYNVGSRTYQAGATDGVVDPADLSVNTTAGDVVVGTGKVNNASHTDMVATGGWSQDAQGNSEGNRYHAYFSTMSAAGGTPEAFGINDAVNIDNAVAAVYR